jgi:hypothetical protein
MNIDLQKNTNGDKRRILSNIVESVYETAGIYVYLNDFDDDYVYFNYYDRNDKSTTFRDKYEYNGVQATLAGDPEVVERFTEYKAVAENPINKAIRESRQDSQDETLLQKITKHFGGSKQNLHPVVKQFEDEAMIAIEPLYIAAGEVDGVGDTYQREDVDYMVNSLNKAIEDGRLQQGLFHGHSTNAFTIEKGWVNEFECQLGDTTILEGQPIVKVQFTSPEAWELRKAGRLTGLSIGARAQDIEVVKNLDALKSEPEIRRVLIKPHFDFDTPEVSYTDPSQGGACSLMNDPFLLKAIGNSDDPLTKEQKEILDAIGEPYVALKKATKDDSSSSAQEGQAEEETSDLTKGNKMSDQDKQDNKQLEALQGQVATLTKALAVSNATNALSPYELDSEIEKGLANAIAGLEAEDVGFVTKALDAMVARVEEEQTKTQTALEKAGMTMSTDADGTPLAKALENEEGHDETQNAVEKSRNERLIELQEQEEAK